MKTTKSWLALAAAFCIMLVLASCSRGEEESASVPASVTKEMAGRYINFVQYDGSLTTTEMQADVTDASATFNLPYDCILGTVLSTDYEAAKATLKSTNVSTALTALRYHNGVATYKGENITATFSYTAGGQKYTGSVSLTEVSVSYDSSAKTLRVAFRVSSLTIDGVDTSSFSTCTVYMQPAEKAV